MYMYMYMYVYVYMYVCVCACKYAYVYNCIHIIRVFVSTKLLRSTYIDCFKENHMPTLPWTAAFDGGACPP